MKIISLHIFFFLAVLAKSQTLAESYYVSTGKGHCIMKIGKDNSYKQEISDCTYGFKTEGTYSVSKDTLILKAAKVYHNFPAGKNKLVTDTASSVIKMSMRFEKYLIRSDSLIQLKYTHEKYFRTWTLAKDVRKTKKK